ncbi:sucrase ferredoxin [Synechococcales cyanobacterium C]|uniref:Sucrase ferredoxin n=1 Tax=Petrachloros mirabilis ULC683 TaxID=2781853 RepID=A0A8K2A2K5_9CYAN|nr:sucrase ferredoxin [Petrachloros mirabilis ULC683]
MTQINTLKKCRLCSEVSKANGEDPIGSAGTYDHFLLIELPEPWSEQAVYQHPQLGIAHKMAKALRQEAGINARVMAIAPDYGSSPNQTRVLHYQKPVSSFAVFQKQEFLIPKTGIVPLATALLTQSEDISQYDGDRQNTNHLRDLMLCTHGSYDVACGRFGYPLYRTLRNDYSTLPLRVWRCTHIGGHQFAPTLLDLPRGHYWGHLEPEILDVLVHHEGTVAELRSHYRGWAGLAWAEQIAEREIWIREGWDWLHYLKQGETLDISDPEADYPDWVEVRIHFRAPNGCRAGTYEARIEAGGQVETMWNSGDLTSIEAVKQYQVSRLNLSEQPESSLAASTVTAMVHPCHNSENTLIK